MCLVFMRSSEKYYKINSFNENSGKTNKIVLCKHAANLSKIFVHQMLINISMISVPLKSKSILALNQSISKIMDDFPINLILFLF